MRRLLQLRFLMFAFFLALLITAGCRREPAARRSTPAANAPFATTQPRDENIDALGEFIRKDAPPRGDVAGLPPGHPPLGDAFTPTAGAALPPGHPAIDSPDPHAGMAGAGAQQGAADSAPLHWDAPAAWKSEPVTSSMRKAQYVLPRAAGDSEDGKLIVFYFGRDQGGTVDLNIARWRGMFTKTDGQPIDDSGVKQGSRQVGDFNVTTLDVSGRYSDPMSGRPAGPTDKDFRMLTAVVVTPEGPWFFKAVGPAATLEAHAAGFQQLVSSLRK